MTREEEICKAAKVDDIGEVSDGFHTFNSLYEQRMILFAALVKVYKDKSWKSDRHEDGEYCFGGGWFIVGIDTPEGSYTYHYKNEYWDLFDCIILPRAKHWDGHTEADAEVRLMSLKPELKPKHGHWIPLNEKDCKCSICGKIIFTSGYDKTNKALIAKATNPYCRFCGAKMDGGVSNMKYYIIYEELYDSSSIHTMARFICIVEHKEIAEDFCKKNSRFYYEEVVIRED